MEQFTEYEGQLNSHNRPHGKGKMRWKTNGDNYDGDFLRGLPDGQGIMHYKTLDYTYVGSFSRGKRHGVGYLLMANRDLLCGVFANDTLEGFCVIYYNNGDFYEGEYKSNSRHGEGTLRYSNGEVYYGNFFNNMRHGVGRLVLKDGMQNYYGTWRLDSFTGRGKVTKFIENSGILAVQEGQFRDGRLHGEGISTDSLGIYYKGEFKSGEMHGTGELIMPNGGKFVGKFKYNDFKRGKSESPDKTISYGNFYHFSPDGIKVKVFYNDGSQYQGGMNNGIRDGFGHYKSQEGTKTLGNFSKGLVTGRAKMSFNDGSDYYSTWRKGKEINPGIFVMSKTPTISKY